MLKNIDIAEFTAEVRYRRDEALELLKTDGHLFSNYREALRCISQSDCWRVEQPIVAAVHGPATWQEFYDDLSFSARRLQHFGATAAQVRLLATLAVEQGLTLAQMSMSTLSKQEASAIINHMKKEG